jgi:tRNA threonylcarbamoyladenosine biosynthesis protein TsaE
MEQLFSLSSLPEMANDFWQREGEAKVFAFHGEMGAGKTTLIHALCDAKGVKDQVGSPTFSIINEYAYEDVSGGGKIFHIDLYRLKDEAEAIQAGVEDCLYSGEVCFVEWPERAPGIFPNHTIHVYIETADSTMRKLRIGGK